YPVKAPLVQAGELSESAPLAPNYIDPLLTAPSLDALLTETAPPASLLYALLRHSMLLEYANAASRILFNNGTPQTVLFKDQELIDIPSALGEGANLTAQRPALQQAIVGAQDEANAAHNALAGVLAQRPALEAAAAGADQAVADIDREIS